MKNNDTVKDLLNKFKIPKKLISFKTESGFAVLADSLDILKKIPNDSIDLIITSPPFGLIAKKK